MKDKKKEEFLIAFNAGYGIILSACEAVHISRTTYYKWMKEDPEFREKVEEIQESQVDFVESRLINAIKAGDTTAIIFYLKTKGKKRGYSEKAIPQKEDKPLPTVQALPEPQSEEKTKAIAAKVRNKKTYLVKLMKKQGIYTDELTYQVDLTAKLLVRANVLEDEMQAEGYQSVNVEYSREGNERVTLNPKEKLYLDVLERVQRALRALGLNTEGKERRIEADPTAILGNDFEKDED